MKIAISLPDDVYQQGEKLALRLKTSRSQLYARALREFASRHDDETVTDAMDKALAELGPKDRAFSSAAARRAFERTEW
jgi:metal-responsive CopG/Arc/MetJ family transcriptional regulator